MTQLQAPGKRDITLGAIGPNMHVEAAYKHALAKAVANMTASYEYWVSMRFVKAVDANVDAGRLPDGAQDAAPGDPSKRTKQLFDELQRLQKYWEDYFDTFAQKVAKQAIEGWYESNATAWQGKLGRAGFDIKMQLTPSQRLILQTKVPENVSLIKSIQQDYHKDIEGIVTRNFLAGRDLAPMAEQIKKRGGVSTRRAALIARDQSNKAGAQMNSARQRELGIAWAKWVHSSAGKEPRPEHVRAARENWYFEVSKGIDFGDGFGFVLPGEAINCRCTSRSIIPALNRMPAGFDASKLVEVPGFPGAYKLAA
jgi:uncharacterized protein with gpF-like domain